MKEITWEDFTDRVLENRSFVLMSVEGFWPRSVAEARHCTYQESSGLHISSEDPTQ